MDVLESVHKDARHFEIGFGETGGRGGLTLFEILRKRASHSRIYGVSHVDNHYLLRENMHDLNMFLSQSPAVLSVVENASKFT